MISVLRWCWYGLIQSIRNPVPIVHQPEHIAHVLQQSQLNPSQHMMVTSIVQGLYRYQTVLTDLMTLVYPLMPKLPIKDDIQRQYDHIDIYLLIFRYDVIIVEDNLCHIHPNPQRLLSLTDILTTNNMVLPVLTRHFDVRYARDLMQQFQSVQFMKGQQLLRDIILTSSDDETVHDITDNDQIISSIPFSNTEEVPPYIDPSITKRIDTDARPNRHRPTLLLPIPNRRSRPIRRAKSIPSQYIPECHTSAALIDTDIEHDINRRSRSQSSRSTLPILNLTAATILRQQCIHQRYIQSDRIVSIRSYEESGGYDSGEYNQWRQTITDEDERKRKHRQRVIISNGHRLRRRIVALRTRQQHHRPEQTRKDTTNAIDRSSTPVKPSSHDTPSLVQPLWRSGGGVMPVRVSKSDNLTIAEPPLSPSPPDASLLESSRRRELIEQSAVERRSRIRIDAAISCMEVRLRRQAGDEISNQELQWKQDMIRSLHEERNNLVNRSRQYVQSHIPMSHMTIKA